jgi:23S rRNA (cytosine1962-C5)-methyltransferase
MAVPPLHHRVVRAGVGRVGLPEARRHRRAVHDVQQRDGQDERAEEPVGDVNMLYTPFE